MKRPFLLTAVIFLLLAAAAVLVLPGRGMAGAKAPQRPQALRENLLYEPDYLSVHIAELRDPNPQSAPRQEQDPALKPDASYDYNQVYQQFDDYNGRWLIRYETLAGDTILTNRPGVNSSPRLNLDSTEVIYVSNQYGQFDILKLGVNGGNPIELTTTTENEGSPYWSPDGSKIVFSRQVNGDWEIYSMVVGGGETRLTNSPGYDGQPSWSRDGAKIAFVSNRSGSYLIYTMNVDGTGLFAVNPDGHYSAHPVWSKDGSQIGFDADYDLDGFQELRKINSDGSGSVLLAKPSPGSLVDYTASDWTFNSRELLFTISKWVYIEGQWYWTESAISRVDVSSSLLNFAGDSAGPHLPPAPAAVKTNGYTDWNMATAPVERVAPTGSIYLSQYSNLPLGSGSLQPYAFYPSITTNDQTGIGAAWLEFQEEGQSGWTLFCKNVDGYYYLVDGCSNTLKFEGVGGKTYHFRLRVMDRAGNLAQQAAYATYQIESDPPFSRWMTSQELKPYTRGRLVPIYTYEEDPVVNGINSRVKYILGEYQVNGGPWQVYYQTYSASMNFTGSPGNTYCFRFRAVDFALNMEPLKPLQPQDCTTLYDWGISGTASDNRGQPLSAVQLLVQPEPSKSFPLNSTGVYSSYLAFGAQTPAPASVAVTYQNPSFGALPATVLDTADLAVRDVVLPPQDDLLQNGQFENGLTGWEHSGLVNSGAALSGLSGLELGLPFRLTQAITFTASGGGVDALVDAQGDFHIVSANTIAVYYRRCTAQGQCDLPVKLADTGTAIFNPKIHQNSQGDLFVVWGDLLPDVYNVVRIVEKPAGGAWSAPAILMRGHTPDMLVDHQDNLIVVALNNSNWGLDAATRVGSGDWITHTLYAKNGPYGVEHLAYEVGPSGRVYIMFGGAAGNPWIYDLTTYLFQWDAQSGWTEKAAPIMHYQEAVYALRYPMVIVQDPLTHKDVIHFAYKYARYGINQFMYNYFVIDPETLQIIASANPRVPENFVMNAVLAGTQTGEVHFFVNSGSEIYWSDRIGNPVVKLAAAKSVGWMWAREMNGVMNVFWATNPGMPIQVLGCQLTLNNCDTPSVYAQVNTAADGMEMAQNALAFLVRQSSGDGLALYHSHQPAGSNLAAQQVTIAAGLQNPTLSFQYRLGGLAQTPDFKVLIAARQTPPGSLQTTELFSSSLPTAGWQHIWRDLTPWAGQTVTLTFQADTPAGALPAVVSLDEISLGSSLPDLQLSGGRVASLLPGESGVFTLVYANPGGLPAPGALITVTLPDGLVFAAPDLAPSMAAPGGPAQAGPQRRVWQLGDLAPGAGGQISFTVTQARAPGVLTSAQITAELATAAPDPAPANNRQVIVLWLAKDRLFTPLLRR